MKTECVENTHLTRPISDSAKAAYLATVIQHGLSTIEKYPGNNIINSDKTVYPLLDTELLKLRRGNPEAFYYWGKISQILKGE